MKKNAAWSKKNLGVVVLLEMHSNKWWDAGMEVCMYQKVWEECYV